MTLNFKTFSYCFILIFFSNFIESQYLIIGDSQSYLLAKNSNAKIYQPMVKSGIGMLQLKKMISADSGSLEAKAIFISIGVNDAYIDYGIKDLIDLIYKKFPFAYLFVVRGSYEWGNVPLTEKVAQRYINFYNKWEELGIYTLENIIGSGDPHFDKPEYKRIGNEIDFIIKKIEIKN